MGVLVLGIGNILWADEGFGVRVVERLGEGWRFPSGVTLMDGGTQGLYLLPHIEEADALVVIDAIDYGLPPGTLRLIRDGDVPAFLGAKKMSLHQTGFQEVLATAQLTGRCPGRLRLVGVQPAVLDDYGGGLTDVVAAQVEPAAALALDILGREFGIVPEPRGAATPSDPVSRHAYEGGRPSAADACRIGDPRVLAGRFA
ncbi:HyaD/HybD family hydrogenase maturation endopeptidase [Azospirillum sp. RWY-5-1]|uniref:HyaD/HybD family hydrogenase maturation endopeptidase n=1 Tax=Azospirillum oleiclasticum TaxID=2735135 RepID=A0ABX2T9H0_9PROT|nr:HyaD/HybD family hydrogenase maturation endopeptidase [Azospirillum oleiclasticum]NYZ12464.1 HyaD/HybD family hydrogenase maturation endopeptidase [Azospirillum oleiclasticum]NYZ19624.1 HyaD/HybD family hydrogenase maturation endopeptidase [Azospirillum oleiclasticum]